MAQKYWYSAALKMAETRRYSTAKKYWSARKRPQGLQMDQDA
jgi:hypothetical protein